jgi:hypothetical protein
MNVGTFDKIAGAAIIASIGFTVFAATSWNWFPTPGEWGDIARIPKSIMNYMALLLPPAITLLYLLIRRWCFTKD